MGWFQGKRSGKPYIPWEKLWFPLDFPLNQSIDMWFSKSDRRAWRKIRSAMRRISQSKSTAVTAPCWIRCSSGDPGRHMAKRNACLIGVCLSLWTWPYNFDVHIYNIIFTDTHTSTAVQAIASPNFQNKPDFEKCIYTQTHIYTFWSCFFS